MVEIHGPHDDVCETEAERHFNEVKARFAGKTVPELRRIANDWTKPYRANVALEILRAAGNVSMKTILIPKPIKEKKE